MDFFCFDRITRHPFQAVHFGMMVVLLGLAQVTLAPCSWADTRPVASAGANAQGDTPAPSFGWNTSATAFKNRLAALQSDAKDLEKDFGNETAAVGNENLANLNERATSLTANATALTTQLKSYQAVYESFLDTIGATPAEGESADIATQRGGIKQILGDIRSAYIQARLLELRGRQLAVDVQRRQAHQKTALLSQKLPSPLSTEFWSHQISEFSVVRAAFSMNMKGKYPGVLTNAWRWLIGLVLVSVIAAFTARLCNRFMPNVENALMHRIGTPPKNGSRLRHLRVVTAGFMSAVVAALLWQFLLTTFFNGAGQPIAESLADSIPLAGFIIGAMPTLLKEFAWRDGHEVRRAPLLHVSSYTLATIVIVQALLVAIAQEEALPFYTRHLIEGIFGIAVTFHFVILLRDIDKVRDQESLLFIPSLRGFALIAAFVTVLTVLIGYTVFAFYVAANVVAIGVGCVIICLFGLTLHELIAWVFGPKAPLARRLTIMGLGSRRVEQFGVVLNFVVNAMLAVLLCAIVLSGGRFDLSTIIDEMNNLFVGRAINGFSLSLNTVLACLLTLVAAYYLISYVKRWLEGRFFPLTKLDVGTRSSISNVLTYAFWIGTLLLVLTEAGVAVQNLTWVVSALSVGIGFGLQSIVQNFVSGVILLAERPIRVGDLVEIGGVKGDVKKISVRATEITLGDGSTMIVPNSLFITSNVRNATMGSPVSTTTANVTIATNADAAKAQEVLLDMMKRRTDILQDPAPGVSIAAINEKGITLAISAKLLSVRDAGGVTNAIMLDAYSALRTRKISLGQPPAQSGSEPA